MRTIIAGSRTCTDMVELWNALDTCPWDITTVISGMAKGPDTMGAQWANEVGIPVEYFPANWDKFGMAAGTIRNVQMAEKAQALIALWDGNSSGTKHMINVAKNKKLRIHIHIV